MSKRANSIRPDGPIASWTAVSNSARLRASAILFENAAISGCPISCSKPATTSSNEREEVRLIRSTPICLV